MGGDRRSGSEPSRDDLRREVALYAGTAMLLGVDFLPLAPRSGDGDGRHGEYELNGVMPESGDDAPGVGLEALRLEYERDAPHEAFASGFTNIVWGEGDPRARLMFIGEAPGAEEDRTGRPFVGRAGQLLDKMIVAMGLARDSVYIANVLKTRPPGNATPTTSEAEACAPYLYGQIGIIRPRVIVTLGLPASRLILGTSESMGRLRGTWWEFEVPGGHEPRIVPPGSVGARIPVMPTYHPAFLLRSYTPENRARVWSDLQKVMEKLRL